MTLGIPWLTALTLTALVSLSACGAPFEDGPGTMSPWSGGKADTTEAIPPELQFAAKVRVGDIIVDSDEAGTGCWYLTDLQNWFAQPRFCHAMLVVDRVGATGITTIEALNKSQGIAVLTDRQDEMTSSKKLAVLRVIDDDGQPLGDTAIQEVVKTARGWVDVKYEEPPVDLYGDPHETGLYCSMLPFRAYLDATGINLDEFWIHRTVMIPFVVSPDELYEAKNVTVIHEWAVDPAAGEPAAEDPPPGDLDESVD